MTARVLCTDRSADDPRAVLEIAIATVVNSTSTVIDGSWPIEIMRRWENGAEKHADMKILRAYTPERDLD